jgi:hypothetical protein
MRMGDQVHLPDRLQAGALLASLPSLPALLRFAGPVERAEWIGVVAVGQYRAVQADGCQGLADVAQIVMGSAFCAYLAFSSGSRRDVSFLFPQI